MYASKENAHRACAILTEINDIGTPGSADLKFLRDFVNECERKLPNEETYRHQEGPPSGKVMPKSRRKIGGF